MIGDRLALLLRLARDGLEGEHDIAEQQRRTGRGRGAGLPGREGEHVGRPVDPAPVAIEPPLLGVVGEA